MKNLFQKKVNRLHTFILIGLTVVVIGGLALQFAKLTEASPAAPNPGHSWSEIECDNNLCVNTGTGRVGIGTTGPAEDLHIYRGDTDVARIYLTGSNQGTGMVYVGQSTSYGGGIVYNGDDNPNLPFSVDHISLFRRTVGTDYEVMHWAHNSNNVTMTGNLTLPNLYLGAGGSEGNIYNADIVQGHDDLRLWGNSARTATIYLDGPANVTGNLTVGGNATVSGQNVCRQDGTYCPAFSTDCVSCDSRFVNISGDTMSGGLGLANNNIDSINNLFINDPGASEGISWNGTAGGWKIDVSPSNRSNADGDLNLYGTANNIHLWRPTQIDGNLTVSGNATVSGQNVCRQDGTYCPAFSTDCVSCDSRFINVGESGDSIADNTIDSSEIQDNTLTASDLAANSCGNSELIDSPTFTNLTVSGTLNIGSYGDIYSDSSWLRLNQNHTQNIYTPRMMRADGGFQVDGTTVIGGDAWVEGDRIRQNTIDGSEIQDNTLTASDLAANSCGNSELIDSPTFTNLTVNGKITANEIDPIYDIDGVKYATYGHSTVGLKEEAVGKVELSQDGQIYSYAIDFSSQEQGSNLWLFFWVTAFGEDWKDLVVNLTPEGRVQVWYELIPQENKIVIYGNKPVTVSYRLIAPRFDWPERNTNLASDQDIEGMKIIK